MLCKALARDGGVAAGPRTPCRKKCDAVDGAWRNAEFTARAAVGKHSVHQLGGADNGVDGAGGNAQRAADAGRLVDAGDHER